MTTFDWWLLLVIIPAGAATYTIVTLVTQLIWGDENDNYRNYFNN